MNWQISTLANKMYFNNIISKIIDILIDNKNYIRILLGLRNTIIIALVGLMIGVSLGTVIALIKVNPKDTKFHKVIKKIADIYTTIIRGTPVTAQLLLIYFGILGHVRNLSALMVAILVFGLNSSAYVSEIIRGGINSVDKGQMEAARSLGLNYQKSMIKVILPQTIKQVLPAIVNEFIALLKETSVAGFITVLDLTKAFQDIVASSYDAFTPYLVMSMIYLIIVVITTHFMSKLEKRINYV